MLELNILWLYPKEMNTYGDYGNLLTLKRRLEWRGYKAIITEYNIGDKLPKQVDLVLGGGGQDSNQTKVQQDLLKIAPSLQKLADSGVPMLVVCGMYQLFGDEFVLSDGETLKGVGVFEGMKTIAGKSRLIGNVTGRSDMFGDIYGYENHSGRTFLADSSALATVPLGEGNNGEDETEGAIYRNVIGTYLHGSVLPKNPKIADFLLEQAFIKRYKRPIKFRQLKLDTDVTDVMRDILEERPR